MPSEPAQEDFTDFQNPKSASVDQLVLALDRAYHRPGLLVWRSFLAGLMYAFGATIGFALVISILAFVLQSFGGLTLLKPAVEKVNGFIQESVQKQTQSQLNSAMDQYTNPSASGSPYLK